MVFLAFSCFLTCEEKEGAYGNAVLALVSFIFLVSFPLFFLEFLGPPCTDPGLFSFSLVSAPTLDPSVFLFMGLGLGLRGIRAEG